MKLDYVSVEKRSGIAVVRFDRKANLNAFNEKLVVELTHAARGFFDDLETHAVVLAGAPNAFSAGFDLKAADSWPSETDDLKRRQRAYGGVRLCKAWEAMPQITIAAMEKLAPNYRTVMELAYFEGLSQPEMSAKMGQPLGTIKTWARTALQSLRDELGVAVSSS